MTATPDASRVVLALTNRLVDVGVAPLRASELWALLDEVAEPGALLGCDVAQLTGLLGAWPGDPARVATLLDSGVALAVRLEGLVDRGIWTLTPFDDAYPPALRARLGRGAPPVLYGAGAPTWLAAGGLGLAGPADADVDVDVAALAPALAALAARHELPVVTGAGPGVDRLALEAAAAAGAPSIGVLADPLAEAIGRASTRRGLLGGRACLCTPFPPAARVPPAQALGRTRVVYALSRATLVVADDDGPVAQGARAALDEGHGPLLVWRGAGAGPGAAALQAAGAATTSDLSDLVPAGPAFRPPAAPP